MCIRALDYCPPVNFTSGDYLRALITADTDLVHNDARMYRVAVIDAFRTRGLYPSGVRSMAARSLVWQTPDEVTGGAALRRLLVNDGGGLPDWLYRWGLSADRRQAFEDAREMCRLLHARLRAVRDSTDLRRFE